MTVISSKDDVRKLQPARTNIKVIGLGGAGCNAVDRMIQVGIPGVEFIAANTDAQALKLCQAPVKIQLGRRLTRGLGAGGQPSIGKMAAEESYPELAAALKGADMVFLTAGMGGGTGTGSIEVAARAARQAGAATVAVVTLPFSFEGTRRRQVAQDGITRLREEVHTLITVPNDRLLAISPPNMTLDVAFRVADDVLRQGVQGVVELITTAGLINHDFADVKRLMEMPGGAFMSVGQGSGAERTVEAMRKALSHPLLDTDGIQYASGALVNFTGRNISFAEVMEAVALLREAMRPEAELCFGATEDENMADRAQVILIAAGVGASPVEVPPRKPERSGSEPKPLLREPEAEVAPGASPPHIDPNRLDLPAFLRRRRAVV